jgi:hypothetical protein
MVWAQLDVSMDVRLRMAYHLVSRTMARHMFGGDVMPALDNSSAFQQYLEFFQTSRDGTRIGIVEIQL